MHIVVIQSVANTPPDCGPSPDLLPSDQGSIIHPCVRPRFYYPPLRQTYESVPVPVPTSYTSEKRVF